MVGGGTQGFVSRFADGTVRFLPFDFIRREDTWFCNTNGRANHGWVAITPDIALADCGDWPPPRVLGDELRFANCQSCHGSQITVTLDSTAYAYRTAYTSLGINCESCHGPGKRHIALVESGDGARTGDVGMRALATVDKDHSLGVCWQCHALKDQLAPGYQSGLTCSVITPPCSPYSATLRSTPMDASERSRTSRDISILTATAAGQ